jgi:CheY-like chemotaxis protein
MELELNAADARVWGDPVRIQQVFWNLLNNACKFSNPGGRIIVRVSTSDPGRIFVDVEDQGRGISAELAPRLFTPFEQGERRSADERRGLGLGLAISKALVEAHNGSISVYSPGLGQGSTFRVELPTCDQPAPLELRPVIKTTNGKSSERFSRRILLVEDHLDTGVVMERLLKAQGYIVERVMNKASALEAAKAGKFDILVSDIDLPDGTGHEIMEELGRDGRMPGIALSGFGTEGDMSRSRRAGFGVHLVKPVNFEELLAEIERHCPAESPAGNDHAGELAAQA